MKKETLKLLFKPLTIVNKVVPKDKNLVMFYTNLGFRDNVKELFDYMISKGLNKKYKIVLSLNDESEIKKIPNGVIVVDNKEGIKYFLRAKYMFFCFGKYPIKPSDSQVVVNLTHGIPLKKLGNTEKGKENIDYNIFLDIAENNFDYKADSGNNFDSSYNHLDIASCLEDNDHPFCHDMCLF